MVHQDVELKRGLRDVYFESTESSFVIGDVGRLIYRGYDIHDLAENASFEEVVHLMMVGHLPNKSELEQFDNTLRQSRSIPNEVIQVIDHIKNGHPMDVLRTAVSSLAAFESDVDDTAHDATLRKGMKITAQVPTIVAAHHRIRSGLSPIDPDTSLSHAANFLYMLNGETPSESAPKLMDKDFIVHADHGSNASAFAARVSAGTQADLHSAVTAGIAVLSGPSHGGAAENVMKMVKEVGSADKAKDYVTNLLRNKERVMGFGHRVYKSQDPRAGHLREGVEQLSHEKGEPEWYEILVAVMDAMKPYQRRGINVNVDFFAGVIYHLLGIPTDLFVPIFAVGRIPGWTIQVLEQYEHNILIRPLLEYTGEHQQKYIPIEER